MLFWNRPGPTPNVAFSRRHSRPAAHLRIRSDGARRFCESMGKSSSDPYCASRTPGRTLVGWSTSAITATAATAAHPAREPTANAAIRTPTAAAAKSPPDVMTASPAAAAQSIHTRTGAERRPSVDAAATRTGSVTARKTPR